MGASCQVAKDGNSTIGIVRLIVNADYPVVGVVALATNASSLIVGFVGLVAKVEVRSLADSVAKLPILVVCA